MASKATASKRSSSDGSGGERSARGLEEIPDRPEHSLPDADTCRAVFEKMLRIRRFEERAGEMYAKAKIGGFLHLAIGEEATIVGATQALRESDYLMSTYREHGQALARGTHPNAVMAELFGRVDGCSKGRGGSMHLFDSERRFLGGYGIVGGNLPLAVGVALASDYSGTEDVTLCMSGDGATNQGTFGEAMNLAALWRLPVVFLVINNQFGMGTALERHSAETDLSRKSEGFGVPGSRCNGMDVLDVHACVSEALGKAREEREPQLVEAVTYRFRGHSMADPEEYRDKEEVEEWRRRDPIASFGRRLAEEDVISEEDQETIDSEVGDAIDEAVRYADDSPLPELDSLYDDLYVYGDQLRGWWTVDERSPEPHRGEAERESGGVAHELAEAGAAYAGAGDAQARRRRRRDAESEGDQGEEGEAEEGGGEPSGEEPEAEGGAD
ncbi:MAG TPA: pyruvate dehydrogenase (acetyl-transferring) E1 component subunit alpha [Thermoleophilaceae bacterium]|nr:pyruvate dehydrogenase (acetyl-transferring) E1 component subunit alpha [Thermoleophilaceae bacterium]